MDEPTPKPRPPSAPDPDLVRMRLAERRNISAFALFAKVTDGPGMRARGLEFSSLILGAVVGGLALRSVAGLVTLWLPKWASILVSLPFMLVGFAMGLVALTGFFAAAAFRFRTGRQWIGPVVLVLAAGGSVGLEPSIGPWWSLAGFWIALLVAMHLGLWWSGPAIGRDIELHQAMSTWSDRSDDQDDEPGPL